MVEFHSVIDLLSGYSYFTRQEPDLEVGGTYTENGAENTTELATWAHPISSVVNTLINVGIGIEHINEYPFSPYNCFDDMEEREPGRFYLSHKGNDVPLVYSLKGRKLV